MDLLSYLQHSWPMLLRLTGEHLAMVGSAVGMAVLIGVPLGILITRFRCLAAPLLALATIVLTLPSIALFGLMIPVFARFGHALGYVPAVTAVFLYSLLPIMRNTYTALANVDPGMGGGARHRHDAVAAPAPGRPAAGGAGDPGWRAYRRGDEYRRGHHRSPHRRRRPGC